MSAITIGGDLIHYEVLGRGRPVLLVHGWIGSWRYWVPAMQQLQLKYRVYALDMYGFGDTGKNPQKYALDHQVQLLFDFMNSMAIPKAAFIGHGLGALAVSEFARLYADKAPRIMLVETPLFDPGNLAIQLLPRPAEPNPFVPVERKLLPVEFGRLVRTEQTSKRFQGCCLESFAFLSTGAADARSRHTYNDLPIVAGKTSLHGAIYRCSCLGRRRPSRLFRTNPDREYAMLD